MGRRKGRKEASETLIRSQAKNDENEREIAEDEEGGGKGRFFACYLLTSLCPRFKGHTYIGFTVNPRRRIRQHNGEIGSGAWRTKKRRPWEMVLCIYGFPTNVAALQFEWAWQHPVESLAVRKAAATFKSLSGLANKIKLAYTMLTLPAWQSLNLTVNFFSTKYQKHTAGCPNLPEHMRIQVCSMDDLPCYTGSSGGMGEDDDWNGDEECELIAVSQESMEDGLTEAQKIGYSAGVLNRREDTEGEKYNSIEEIETSYEQGVWRGETGLKQLQNSSLIREEDNWQSFRLDDSPVRASSSSISSCNDITKDAEGRGIPKLFNGERCNLIEENETNYEQGVWRGETGLKQLQNSLIREEDNWQSFRLDDDSPVRASSSSISSCNDIAKDAEDRGIPKLFNECTVEYDQLPEQLSPTKTVVNRERVPSISSAVEVIDLFTPSPGCKASKGNKKKRRLFPEIIDLTKSPMFV